MHAVDTAAYLVRDVIYGRKFFNDIGHRGQCLKIGLIYAAIGIVRIVRKITEKKCFITLTPLADFVKHFSAQFMLLSAHCRKQGSLLKGKAQYSLPPN